MGMRWDPFRDVMSLREAMDRLLEESVIRPSGNRAPAQAARTLPIDLWETPERYVLRTALPGAKPDADDVEISIDQNVLTIRGRLPGVAGEESEGKGDEARGTGHHWVIRELPQGELVRRVELPMPIDPEQASAHFGDGLLVLTLPKAKAARPQQIKISTGASGPAGGSSSRPSNPFGQSGPSSPSGTDEVPIQSGEPS